MKNLAALPGDQFIQPAFVKREPRFKRYGRTKTKGVRPPYGFKRNDFGHTAPKIGV